MPTGRTLCMDRLVTAAVGVSDHDTPVVTASRADSWQVNGQELLINRIPQSQLRRLGCNAVATNGCNSKDRKVLEVLSRYKPVDNS